jgi:hypothetical protein
MEIFATNGWSFSNRITFFFEETGGAGAPTGSKLIKTREK